MNGSPPYTEQERSENNIEINTNFLDAPQLVADARRSLYNAFQAPGKFFTVSLDYGPPHSRIKWGRTITNELKRIMKGSRLYAECLDSQCASVVLHGSGPAVWTDPQHWVPEEKGIEDVLIPSGTLRSLRNLDHFAVFYQYTAEQLYRLTHGARVDKRWNMDIVENALEWAHSQTQSQLSYSDLFSPEKVEERYKQDLGFYGTDAVPTIDFWKFFYHEDKANESGWRMCMVLDTPGDWEVGKAKPPMPKDTKYKTDQSQWLYKPSDKPIADSLEQIIHFQFGDLSAVSPFEYHSIRSLGWLLYSISHLQNRVLCKYYEAVIEGLNQYFRGNEQDRTRVQKIDLVNWGFVPDGVTFVRPEERWKVDPTLADQALTILRQKAEFSAAQYRQGRDQTTTEREKTATQVMAEVNSAMSMVGAMLTQAYRYQSYQYREICRRFCLKDSSDPEVRQFRACVLRKNVPEEALDHALWDIEPEKVMGGGNKTLQLAMAQSLLEMRPLLDPESQRIVDRIVIGARTDNDELADRLVPEIKAPSNSAHDAANSFATLMLGIKVPPMNGTNHVDSIEVLLADMAQIIKPAEEGGRVLSPDKIAGLENVAQHIELHLRILSQVKAEKERVRQYAGELSDLRNILKAHAQRLMEMAKKQQSQKGNGQGIDPETAVKLQGKLMLDKAKAENMIKSHGERTAQKRVQFQEKMKQDEEKHQLSMRQEAQKMMLETASEINRNRLQSLKE